MPHNHTSCYLAHLMAAPTRYVGVIRRLSVWLFLLGFSWSVGWSQDVTTEDSLKQSLLAALATPQEIDDVGPLQALTLFYGASYKMDSLRKYNQMLAAEALEAQSYDLHAGAVLDIWGSKFTLGKDIDDYKATVDYLDSLRYAVPLSYDVRAQIHLLLVSYNLQLNNCGLALMHGDTVLMYTDSSDVMTTKCSRRIQISESSSSCEHYNRAIDILLEAEVLTPFTQNPVFFDYKVTFNLGKLFQRIGDDDKAAYYLGKAQRLVETKYKSFRADVYSEQAKLDVAQGRYAEADNKISKGLSAVHASPLKSRVTNLYFQKLDVLTSLGRLAEAQVYADSLITQIDKGRSPYNLSRYYGALASLAVKRGKLPSARQILDRAKQEVAKGQQDGYLLHAEYELAKAVVDTKSALNYYIAYHQVRDSIEAATDVLRVQRLENDYNRKKKEVEIAALNKLTIAQDKAIAVKNTALSLGGAGLFALSLLLFGLYRLYQKNRAQTVLITKALSENKLLLREIHHRVKNNLQVISSLLSMQTRRSTDADAREALRSTNSRIQSVSLLHQNLYQEENITDVDVKDYLKRLVESIASSYDSGDRIRFELDLESLQLDVDQLVPVGLIANELVCNAVKYAFDEGVEGTIGISLSSTDTDYRLQVRDDGKGLPTPELVVKKHSLGTRLIKSFVDRLDGRLEVDNQQGTTVTITWPKNQSS